MPPRIDRRPGRLGVNPLDRRPDKGGHILPHVGKSGLTNPRLMRRDQSGVTVDPPRGGDRVLDPPKPPRF
jgi:hypothetical protein